MVLVEVYYGLGIVEGYVEGYVDGCIHHVFTTCTRHGRRFGAETFDYLMVGNTYHLLVCTPSYSHSDDFCPISSHVLSLFSSHRPSPSPNGVKPFSRGLQLLLVIPIILLFLLLPLPIAILLLPRLLRRLIPRFPLWRPLLRSLRHSHQWYLTPLPLMLGSPMLVNRVQEQVAFAADVALEGEVGSGCGASTTGVGIWEGWWGGRRGGGRSRRRADGEVVVVETTNTGRREDWSEGIGGEGGGRSARCDGEWSWSWLDLLRS